MAVAVDEAKRNVLFWTQKHPQAVAYDGVAMLKDIASGKSLRISWGDVEALEEKTHPETQESYLVLLFENARQIALVDPGGIAFAPDTRNAGPVQGLPAVVCLRDFLVLKQRIDHYLYDHPDDPPPRECLDSIMVCIATLDGARAVGFDIGDFEGELEKSLNELERRAG